MLARRSKCEFYNQYFIYREDNIKTYLPIEDVAFVEMSSRASGCGTFTLRFTLLCATASTRTVRYASKCTRWSTTLMLVGLIARAVSLLEAIISARTRTKTWTMGKML
jgi:hypothetical protein